MRSTRRGGRTHGPGALGGRAAVRGVPLACLCARLSATARREDRNGLACEASPAALSATHSVECVPAAARGVPPLAATPAPPFARLEGAPPPLTPMAARDKTWLGLGLGLGLYLPCYASQGEGVARTALMTSVLFTLGRWATAWISASATPRVSVASSRY